MSNITVVCPLGNSNEDGSAACDTVRNNRREVCAWYVKLQGKDPQSLNQYDEWRCALAWMPIIGVENSQTNRGQTQAIEKLHGTIYKTRPVVLYPRGKLNGQDQLGHSESGCSPRLIPDGGSVSRDPTVDGGDLE